MNTDGLLKVLHSVIDLLGGGAQHLHADLEAAAGRTPAEPEAPAPTADEIAAAQALLARVPASAEAQA